MHEKNIAGPPLEVAAHTEPWQVDSTYKLHEKPFKKVSQAPLASLSKVTQTPQHEEK